MLTIREYVDRAGRNHYAEWFDGLNAQAAAKVSVALSRMEQGNFSNVEGVGSGVYEYKLDFGPGYRIYFGKEGDKILILLGGGAKKRQHKAINKAQELWQEYKNRKKQERSK
jgi:putative addiction module killer protein